MAFIDQIDQHHLIATRQGGLITTMRSTLSKIPQWEPSFTCPASPYITSHFTKPFKDEMSLKDDICRHYAPMQPYNGESCRPSESVSIPEGRHDA